MEESKWKSLTMRIMPLIQIVVEFIMFIQWEIMVQTRAEHWIKFVDLM